MGAEVPEPDEAGPRLATVIGKNAHRLRTNAGLTLDQVSIAAQRRGLRWSESRVADFEAGRVAPNLGTLVAFCVALADLGCTDATLPGLVEYDPPIEINDSLRLSASDLVLLMTGHPVEEPKRNDHPANKTALESDRDQGERIMVLRPGTTEMAVRYGSGATEKRIRKSLGISYVRLIRLSADLWGRSFSQERDRRAGEGANAQKRGQVSRQMRKELQAAIEAATHGDDQ